MTDITADRLKEIATLADELPDEYRVAAFRELVRQELAENELSRFDGEARSPAPETGDDGGSQSPGKELPAWFDDVLAKTPEQHVVADGTRDVQAAWALVELFKAGEPGTAAACRKLIKDMLGITPEGRPHMSNRLGSDFTPKYATRYPVDKGRGYRYEPTRKIVELFAVETEE